MPLNGNDLGDQIKSYMDTALANIEDKQKMTPADILSLKRAEGNAIVDYLKANGEVTLTLPGTVETFTPLGVGSNGGALTATVTSFGVPGPVAGTINTGPTTSSEGRIT